MLISIPRHQRLWYLLEFLINLLLFYFPYAIFLNIRLFISSSWELEIKICLFRQAFGQYCLLTDILLFLLGLLRYSLAVAEQALNMQRLKSLMHLFQVDSQLLTIYYLSFPYLSTRLTVKLLIKMQIIYPIYLWSILWYSCSQNAEFVKCVSLLTWPDLLWFWLCRSQFPRFKVGNED